MIDAVAYHHHPRRSKQRDFTSLTAVHVANYLERRKNEQGAAARPSEIDEDYLADISLEDRVNQWEDTCFSGSDS
ncbi:MAG: hypothetical protein ACE5JX_14250 [Acidobacteriota bacterium]